MCESNLIRFEEKLKSNMHNSESVFEELIDFLKYNNSQNFHLLNTKEKSECNIDFDAEYTIKTHEEQHSIIIIKKVEGMSEGEISQMHRKYWNSNRTPISIFVFSDEIRIYNNFTLDEQAKTILKCKNRKDLKKLLEYEESNILSGIIWERISKQLKKVESVDKRLLNNLKCVLEKLHFKYGMEYGIAHNFIARCIFIKYLEDRKAITHNTFNEYDVDNFTELLEPSNSQKVIEFFVSMKERFNGDLFSIVEEKDFITSEQLEEVWEFFKGTDPCTGQKSFFPYDFSVIPIELISNVYETFLDLDNKKKDGTFYTPYFLANFVLKYSLEEVIENKENFNVKVLDPACGSGIFLVESFKRIVEFYKKKNIELTATTLKQILEQNIFGVDINKEALKIACFSLYIALLDYLEPKDIAENNFKFPNLIGNNLFCNDFFDETAKFNGLKFDVILGNPPWGSVSAVKSETLHETYFQKNNIPVSDKQIAQSFMARVKDFANNDTIITLIVSSKIFYNHLAYDFRKYFLKNYELNFIIDLTIAKDNIFKSASAPCTIVSYKLSSELREHENNKFVYYSFKPNCFTVLLKKIVIEPGEINRIEQRLFEEYDYLWKVMLFGNEFDFSLIKKLKKNQTLQEYLNSSELLSGQGFARGNGKDEYPELINMPLIGGKNYLYSYHVDSINLPVLEDANFERLHDKRMYKGPHLLIKRTVPTETYRCVSSIFYEDAVFPNTINAIACLNNDKESIEKLRYLEAIINSKICTYYHFHTSSGWGTERPEILIKEHREFPLINPNENYGLYKSIIKMTINIEEQVDEFFKLKERYENEIMKDPEIEYEKSVLDDSIKKKQQELDELIYDLYGLNDIEKQTIEYTHEILTKIHRYRNSPTMNTDALKFCDSEEFKKYACIITNHFNELLNEQGLCLKEEIFEDSYFTAINFKITSIDDYEALSDCVKSDVGKFFKLLGFSSISEISDNIYVQRKIRGFTSDSFYIIKTKERKNWMKMNAIIDINEFTKEIFLAEGSEE